MTAPHPRRPDDGPFKLTRTEGPDWLTDYFAKMMPAALEALGDLGDAPAPAQDGFLIPSAVDLTARKLVSYIDVPDELLMAYGLIPDTRPKPPPPTWRTRLRRKRDAWRERMAHRAFKVIAGYEAPGGEDW